MNHVSGVRELRQGLAAAVHRASAGERTIITSHGQPVAQLAPLADAAVPDLERLVAIGALVPPRRTDAWRAPTPAAVWAGARLDHALRDLRR